MPDYKFRIRKRSIVEPHGVFLTLRVEEVTMRRYKTLSVVVVALFALVCLSIVLPAGADGDLVPGTPDYCVLAQYSATIAAQDWHLISQSGGTNTYCWTRSKPHFLYTYAYTHPSEATLEIETIATGSTVLWRWTPSTGWYLV